MRVTVIGASGGMGYSIVKELSQRGIKVHAFARNQVKLQSLFGDDSNVTIFLGDVFNLEDLFRATAGSEIIFHALNIPYPQWEEKQPILMKNILNASAENNCKLAIVDNIYAYGRSNGEKVKEVDPKDPHTKKGRIRLQLEEMAKGSGVKVLIAHFPDFYGPNAENTILHFTLQNVVQGKSALFVGDPKIRREYIFTPDGAKALVELALRDTCYGQNWNIPGYGVISGEEILKILRIYGFQRKMVTIRPFMIKCLGLFDRMLNESYEMMYLTKEPVVLCGDKLEKELGEVERTSFREGILQTLTYMERKIKEL